MPEKTTYPDIPDVILAMAICADMEHYETECENCPYFDRMPSCSRQLMIDARRLLLDKSWKFLTDGLEVSGDA